ncbi:hypothetical protein D910_12490 [Dendroctonus ponderosae]
MMGAKTINNITMKDVCFRIPKVNKKLLKLMISETEDDLDPSMTMPAALYCSFIETMKTECYTKSILELWDFNMTQIALLTKDDIVYSVNTYNKDLIFGKLKSYDHLLGGIVRNETGHIISAKAIDNYWLLLVNFSSVDMNKAGNMAGTGEWASEEALDWELTFLNISETLAKDEKELYYFSGRSFGDISNNSMFQDIDKLSIGIVIMVIYVQFVISKFNWLEARILPCLESFCIYAACGVFMTFVFVITFFMACFVLDQKRLESNRNGIIPCIEHPTYKPNKCSQSRLTSRIFEYVYGNIILTTPGKVRHFDSFPHFTLSILMAYKSQIDELVCFR